MRDDRHPQYASRRSVCRAGHRPAWRLGDASRAVTPRVRAGRGERPISTDVPQRDRLSSFRGARRDCSREAKAAVTPIAASSSATPLPRRVMSVRSTNASARTDAIQPSDLLERSPRCPGRSGLTRQHSGPARTAWIRCSQRRRRGDCVSRALASGTRATVGVHHDRVER